MHKTLKNWRARRAGGRITVYGEDHQTGQQVKITNVDDIKPGGPHRDGPGGYCVAVDKDSVSHRLLT